MQHEYITGRRAVRVKAPDSIRRTASGYLIGARPLPEQPSQLLKAPISVIKSMGANSNSMSSSSVSPSKNNASISKRQSMAPPNTTNYGSVGKRTSAIHFGGANSSLPRVAARTASISGHISES